jgi:hypothetical protein
MRKHLVVFLGIVGLALIIAGPASSAPVPKLRTFGTGEVTLTGTDAATIVNESGEYGGVYVPGKAQSGLPVAQASFSFRNDGGDIAGGAPRLSIPIDDPTTGPTNDAYAFIDLYWCGGAQGDTTTEVSTDSATCVVWYDGVSYANWSAFATAHPDFRIARGRDAFVIADQPGTYRVADVDLT